MSIKSTASIYIYSMIIVSYTVNNDKVMLHKISHLHNKNSFLYSCRHFSDPHNNT